MSITGKFISQFTLTNTTSTGDEYLLQRGNKYFKIPKEDLFTQIMAEMVPLTSGWLLAGNAGTNPSTQFIGTTDNVSFGIRTNNLNRVFINGTTGSVGINTQAPSHRLHVNGSTLIQATSLLSGIASEGSFIIDNGNVGNTIMSVATANAGSFILRHKRVSNAFGAAIEFNAGAGVYNPDGVSFRVGSNTSADTSLKAHINNLGDFVLGYQSAVVTTPARLHVQAKTADASGFAVKINDSNDNALLWIRTDQRLGINRNDASATVDIKTVFTGQNQIVLRGENTIGNIFAIYGNSYMTLGESNGTARLGINKSGTPMAFPPQAALHIKGDIRLDGQSSNTAGASTGTYLIINIDGVQRKIALLANA